MAVSLQHLGPGLGIKAAGLGLDPEQRVSRTSWGQPGTSVGRFSGGLAHGLQKIQGSRYLAWRPIRGRGIIVEGPGAFCGDTASQSRVDIRRCIGLPNPGLHLCFQRLRGTWAGSPRKRHGITRSESICSWLW
ncbi:hypothetical protein CapIbe_018300 [Capra ibex]